KGNPLHLKAEVMQTEKVIDHIVDWLGDYARQANSKGFVVGVSGGIDSAVTSTLCARTSLEVLCLEMPIHQGTSQISRAVMHMAWLKENYPNVSRERVDLGATFDTMVDSFPATGGEGPMELALANTRARLRMATLYYFAGLGGLLVAGTGNKGEDFGIGFYTKYGDGGVDLSPIADLLKSEVYELGGALGINRDIMEAPPTDGLFGDSRTDQDQIGASYPELEWAMAWVEAKKPTDGLPDREKQVIDIYKKYNTANRHKMVPIPICMVPKGLK